MIRRRYRSPKPPSPPSPEEAALRRQRMHAALFKAMSRRVTLPTPPTPQPMGPAAEPDYPKDGEP